MTTMTPTPTARRTTADDGTVSITIDGLDEAAADRAATLLGAAFDLDVEDAEQPAASAKGETRLTAADLEQEVGHIRAARTEAALDEWVRTGEVTR